MKYIQFITAILGLFFLTSCEDVIDVDLNTAPSRLVIDASINWYKGTDGSQQTIRLTRTSAYYAPAVPLVSGATVYITSAGNTFNFAETANAGEYVCTNFVPVIGQNYVLTVIAEGETYTASETLFPVPPIAPEVEQDNDAGVTGDDIEITFHYQDNGNLYNYYFIRLDCPIAPFPELHTRDNEFAYGNLLYSNYDHEDLAAGDPVTFTLYGISEPYQNYMGIVINASDSGGPFETTPANARGNIVNQTNAGNYALGYFRLSEADTKTYIVE